MKTLREIDDVTMSAIACYMDDDIREMLHGGIAPCSNEKFLAYYLHYDPEFAVLLRGEFSVDCSDAHHIYGRCYYEDQLSLDEDDPSYHIAAYVKSHRLSLLDFDCWRQLETILERPVTYAEYARVDSAIDDCLLDYTAEDRAYLEDVLSR